jgi:hypothetical protein
MASTAAELQYELHEAIESGQLGDLESILATTPTARVLLQHEPLLHEAVGTDDVQIVTALLRHGASVNLQDARGRTALHCVQSRGVADVLLRAGSDIHARDNNGLTAHEERRAFGVRGLTEVADFVESWRGTADLRVRPVEQIVTDLREAKEQQLRTNVEPAGRSDLGGSERRRTDGAGEGRGGGGGGGLVVQPVSIVQREAHSPDAFHSRDMLMRTPPSSPDGTRASGGWGGGLLEPYQQVRAGLSQRATTPSVFRVPGAPPPPPPSPPLLL